MIYVIYAALTRQGSAEWSGPMGFAPTEMSAYRIAARHKAHMDSVLPRTDDYQVEVVPISEEEAEQRGWSKYLPWQR